MQIYWGGLLLISRNDDASLVACCYRMYQVTVLKVHHVAFFSYRLLACVDFVGPFLTIIFV
jgi:hypothetical protein